MFSRVGGKVPGKTSGVPRQNHDKTRGGLNAKLFYVGKVFILGEATIKQDQVEKAACRRKALLNRAKGVLGIWLVVNKKACRYMVCAPAI